MGIRNLQNWIRWYVPHTIESPQWTSFSGKTLGIDILGFLYRAKSQGVYPINYVAKLIAACKRFNIQPIIIFDGKAPSEKKVTLSNRTQLRTRSTLQKNTMLQTMPDECRNELRYELQKLELNSTYLTSEERDQVKQFLYSCGVLSLNASGEADNTLAYFSRKGWIDGVISSDFDLLARGVETLIMPSSDLLHIPGESGWKQYTLSKLLDHSGLTYEQFVDMCVMMGSDYTADLKTIPYKTAYWSVKHAGCIEYTLARYCIDDYTPYKRAKQILMGINDTEESLMNAKQWEKWHGKHPTIEIETLYTFAKLYFEQLLSGDCILNDLTQNAGTMSNNTAAASA